MMRYLIPILLAFSSVSGEIQEAKHISKAFTHVAKTATPAVVSIQVTLQTRSHPFGFFDDPFFEHFFKKSTPDRKPKYTNRVSRIGVW